MVTPYFTQHRPPALVATLPPIEQISYDDGSGGYHSPCSAAAALTSTLRAPGSTTATRAAGSISTARIRSSDSDDAAVDRGRSAREPRAGATRHDGHPVPGRPAHGGLHVLGATRPARRPAASRPAASCDQSWRYFSIDLGVGDHHAVGAGSPAARPGVPWGPCNHSRVSDVTPRDPSSQDAPRRHRAGSPTGPPSSARTTPTGSCASPRRGDDIDGEARFVDALADRGAAILDAGCGVGRVAGRLARGRAPRGRGGRRPDPDRPRARASTPGLPARRASTWLPRLPGRARRPPGCPTATTSWSAPATSCTSWPRPPRHRVRGQPGGGAPARRTRDVRLLHRPRLHPRPPRPRRGRRGLDPRAPVRDLAVRPVHRRLRLGRLGLPRPPGVSAVPRGCDPSDPGADTSESVGVRDLRQLAPDEGQDHRGAREGEPERRGDAEVPADAGRRARCRRTRPAKTPTR